MCFSIAQAEAAASGRGGLSLVQEPCESLRRRVALTGVARCFEHGVPGGEWQPPPTPCQGQSEAQEMRPVSSVRLCVGRVAGSTGGCGTEQEQPGQRSGEHAWAGQLACTVRSVTNVPGFLSSLCTAQRRSSSTRGHSATCIHVPSTRPDSQANTAAHPSSHGPSASPPSPRSPFFINIGFSNH